LALSFRISNENGREGPRAAPAGTAFAGMAFAAPALALLQNGAARAVAAAPASNWRRSNRKTFTGLDFLASGDLRDPLCHVCYSRKVHISRADSRPNACFKGASVAFQWLAGALGAWLMAAAKDRKNDDDQAGRRYLYRLILNKDAPGAGRGGRGDSQGIGD
jgi:hypothetical protein